MSELIPIFIFFFAVIDPIGSVPVFIATTSGFDAKAKRHIAYKAIIAAAGILLFFTIAGAVSYTHLTLPTTPYV